jgi:hypothetical protein
MAQKLSPPSVAPPLAEGNPAMPVTPNPPTTNFNFSGDNNGIITQGQTGGTNTVIINKDQRRVLPSALIAELTEMASRFSGQRFTMTSLMGDQEGRDLAMQIVAALDKGGWDHNGPAGIGRAVRTDQPVGIVIEINPAEIEPGHAPAAAVELLKLFVKYGLMEPVLTRVTNPGSAPPLGTIGLLIGTKPLKP